MLRFFLLIPALALLTLGAEGLYHASRGRNQATLTCEQFATAEPPSLLVRLTACEIDYAGAAYTESGGRIAELFFPVRPAGHIGTVPVIAVTTHPAALKIAGRLLGGSRQPTTEESVAVMQKAAAAAGAGREIRGLVRSGLFQRLATPRVLSGIGVPLSDNVSVVDLHRSPNYMIPGLELIAALVMLGAAFLLPGRATPPATMVLAEDNDRAEVIERLRRHTEALRAAEERPAASTDASVARASTQETKPELPARLSDASKHQTRNLSGQSIDKDAFALVHADEMEPARFDEPVRGEGTDVRLPPLMLLNVAGGATAADIEAAPPLGPREEVLARLREVLPDLDVEANGHARHAGPDYSVALDLGTHDVVHTVVIEATGETGVSVVRWMMESTGWRAFVPKSGRFVEADALDRLAIR